ncbi:MAG TPA: hypothetical protein VKB46_29060 [Pyrinomonadaceae bacterium]|nr:hypothetical protein [Pyrinomonadaceae bacterium]
MTPRLVALLLLVLSFVSASCQNYTSGLQQTVKRADETSAIAALRSISIAQQAYTVSNSGEFGTLKQLIEGGFLDARMASDKPVKDYVLSLKVTPKNADPAGSYTCNADPDATVTAGKHYYIDSSSNVIHVNETQPATSADKSIE